MADDVAIRNRFEGIAAKPEHIWRSFAYWGGGGYLASAALGGINPMGAALMVALTRLYSPGIAKYIMSQLASSSGMPTVASINKMALPREVKDSLIGGLVNYLNESPSDGKPVPVSDMATGTQIHGFLKKNPDAIVRAKNLTTLHKDRVVDPEIIRQWILDGSDPSGKMKEYFEKNLPGGVPQTQYKQESGGLPAGLVDKVIEVESAGNPKAVSRAGAAGLMQLMPKTAESLGLSNKERFDPEKNVAAGTKYLNELYERLIMR
jgi:hypothetical protein